MVERGRLMALLLRKSVLLPVFFVLALLMMFVTGPKAAAINESINPNDDGITGLWSTGVDNNGNLLDLPGGPWPNPSPSTIEYQEDFYEIDNEDSDNNIEDPHWDLVRIERGNNRPHCQGGQLPRRAVVVMPPWNPNLDAAANPGSLNGDGGWVWWRRSMHDPAKVLDDNFADRGARWIGARPNAFHDSDAAYGESSPGVPAGCVDPSLTSSEASPTWVYQLRDGFRVGSCIDENTIQFNMYYAADNLFEMIVNEGTQYEKVLVPRAENFGTVLRTDVTNNAFRPGNNTLTVKVTSGYPLQGFALAWDEPTADCTRSEPYLKIFGNDVAAGGTFGKPCDLSSLPNPRATILAHHKQQLSGNTEHWKGASAQLGVFALGQIEGFFSGGNQSPRRNGPSLPANQRVSSSPVSGLTFGNFGDPAIGEGYDWDSSNLILDPNRVLADGGKGGQFRCIPDYFDIVSNRIGGSPQTTNSINLQSVTQGYYKPASGKLRINSSATITGKHIIVVDGDVHLPNAFRYGNYNNASAIPSVYIIAKGNIYIDQENEEISGVFIAQPIDNPVGNDDKGTIYTCSNNSGPILRGSLRTGCNNRLTINGAFIANRVRFLRTNGNVANATPNETWTGSGASDNIAEVFKSSAELYLSVPQLLDKPTNGSVRYDSITNLPPIL